MSDIVANYVAIYLAPLVGYLILRLVTVAVVLHFMMRRARGMADADGTPAVVHAESGAPAAALRIIEIDAGKDIPLDERHQQRLERALKTGGKTWKILWLAYLSFAVVSALVVVAVAPTVLNIFAVGLAIFAFVLLLAAGSRYRSARRVPIGTQIGSLLTMAAAGAAAWKIAGVSPWLAFLPVAAPLVVVAAAYGRIRSAARADGNLKLLVLRVFGSDRNTLFVFGPITGAWQFIGSFFTVVDPSYVRYQFSLSSSENRWKLLRFFTLYGLFISIVLGGAVWALGYVLPANPTVAALTALQGDQRQELLGMLAWLILIPLAILPTLLIVRHRFIGSPEKMTGRIGAAEHQRGGWNGVFKSFPMYCYDNVWKRAVDALLKTSDAVLMDLRGFSPERLGCEYEIGVLIDRFPIQKTLFLVDQAETKQAVYELIQRRWSSMSSTSPNRGIQSPSVAAYAIGKEEVRDIPRILALATAAADKTNARGYAEFAERAETSIKPWVPSITRRKWRRAIRHAFESADMAISTPSGARVAVPAMLLIVGGLLWMRLTPAVQTFRAFANPQTVAVAEAPSRVASVPAVVPANGPADRNETVAIDAQAMMTNWSGSSGGRDFDHPIEVAIELTGGAAADAYSYGVQMSATGPGGAPMQAIDDSGFGPRQQAEDGFTIVNRGPDPFQPPQPEKGLRVTKRFFRPTPAIARIDSLRGSITARLLDPAQMLSLDKIGTQVAGPGKVRLSHPKLATVGTLSLEINPQFPDFVTVAVENPRVKGVALRLIGADRHVIAPNMSANVDELVSIMVPADAAFKSARLDVIWGFRSIEIPFDLKNVAIKPASTSASPVF